MAEENWKIVKSITLLSIFFMLQKQSKLIAENVENRNEQKEDKPFESLLLRNNHQQFFCLSYQSLFYAYRYIHTYCKTGSLCIECLVSCFLT